MAKSSKGGKGGWQEGVSFGSAGRLGAHAAGFEPAENGYLTYQTVGASFLLIGPERRVIGSLQLPPEHTAAERTRSWTLRTARYTARGQDDFPAVNLQVLCSVVSPAVTFASATDRLLRWRWQVRYSPQWTAYPTRDGVRIAHYSRGYPLRAFNRQAAYMFEAGYRRGKSPAALGWTGRWMITFNPRGHRDVPVLWVFHGPRPRRIEVTTYEYMDLHFARPFERVSAMPLYGSAEIDREELAGFCSGVALTKLGRWADHWADVIRKLPDEVEEHFRIDESAGQVHVRQTGRRTDGKRPGVCPVPPFLAAARRGGYPVEIANRPLESPGRDLGTHYGPFETASGAVLRYTIPLCPYLETVLSPVRVRGDARAARMTRDLRAYFDNPKHTYGGDGTYDPDSLLDILHNLRVLAWAVWSLPPEQRDDARKAIARDFEGLFRPESYTFYREPVTGRTIARDPMIFDWCGDVTYDFDWYSGMNLAGLFAGVYFGAIDAAAVRRQWKLVRDVEAYFEVFQDWAIMAPWTDMRGETLNIDCARHGAQGMIGFARLADRFGLRRQRDLARYIASRYMVFWAAEHALPGEYERLGVPTAPWGRRGGGSMQLGFGGLYERDAAPSVVGSAVRNPYTLSPLNPEHNLFLRDFGPVEKLQRYEAEVLSREVPGWDSDPAGVYFGMRTRDSIEHNTGAYHFYMVDPHLLLRMLTLDWPSRRAIGRVRELSGQVMEAALVADAPKVLCPASVEFAGTEWDARAKVLTIRGQARKAGVARWQILWPDRPGRVEGPEGMTKRFAKGRLILQARCDGPVTWRVSYDRH